MTRLLKRHGVAEISAVIGVGLLALFVIWAMGPK